MHERLGSSQGIGNMYLGTKGRHMTAGGFTRLI